MIDNMSSKTDFTIYYIYSYVKLSDKIKDKLLNLKYNFC
jgi:hypothetical protein